MHGTGDSAATLCGHALEVAGAGIVVVDDRCRPLAVNALARSWLGADLDELQRRPLGHTFVLNADQTAELPRKALPLAIALRGVPVDQLELVLVGPDRPLRRLWVSAAPILDRDGATLGAVAVGWDVTAVRHEETQAARSATQLSAMAAARRAVLADTDPREAVARAVVAVTGAMCATVLEVRGDVVEVTAASTPGPRLQLRLDQPSLVRTVHETGQSLFVADVHAEPGVDVDAVRQVETAAGHRVRSGCWVPIHSGVEVVGVLAAVFATDGPAVEDEVSTMRTMELLASEAALAIERDDLRRRLAAQALTDELTGLANLRAWRSALARMPRRGGLAIIDLDHFKNVNDTAGHAAGDKLLVDFAQALLTTSRAEDLVARIGGEEFAVLCPHGGDVAVLINRLRQRWTEANRVHPVPASFSAGVAARGDDEQPDRTQARADEALYAAKQSGRDRIVIARDGTALASS